MNEIASLLAATGVGSVVTALVAGLFGWRLRSANYAQIVSEMSRQVAADLREDNEILGQRVDRLESRVSELTAALWTAITRLDEHGHDTDPLRAVLHGRTNGTAR
ncbi:hypothetical protein [Nocardia cyriacigeorgica]|uniref:hypothetical protein n=1 Tax=Nocardia cyriacigeorgica TaxID=135487 RepID=UPI002455FE03|nr:hypothetical protein [Nocardia cyriacigeorgica]